MDSKEKQLYFNSITIDLEKIRYDVVNNPKEIINNINIVACDSYNIIDSNINGFTLMYKRSVEFEPNVLYEIEVVYKLHFNFDIKTIDEYKNNYNELKELIAKKAEKAINMVGVASRASALISSITMQNNGNAVITQPNYIKKVN